MSNFKKMLEESVKKINSGKVLKTVVDGQKLSIAVGQQKDVISISLGKEYVVLTDKDAKDFMDLLK